jgi:hypothetical protein
MYHEIEVLMSQAEGNGNDIDLLLKALAMLLTPL